MAIKLLIINFSNAAQSYDFFSNIQTIAFFLYDKECYFEVFSYTIYSKSIVYLRSCLNNNYMIEQFNFDIQLIFAILNGKVSAAINRKLSRNFRQNGMEITPEQWTVLLFLWEKDGVTQQELCNATFKDKPSMTRLIDNMERQHLVVRISDKKDRRTNLIHLTKTGKELEEMARFIANKTLKEALHGLTLEELRVSQEVLRKIFTNTKD